VTHTLLDIADCESVVRRLWPFLDDALPDTERSVVAEHLATCTGCRSHFDFAAAFLSAVSASGAPIADVEALRARVVAALENDGFALP
jgi:anti-sigma factor RsiW